MAAAQPVLLVALLASLFAPLAKAGPMTSVVVATTSALIFAGQTNDAHLNPLLFRPSIFLGNISYSLYLWHWSILYIARSLGLNQGWLNEVAIVTVCLVVGYASYRYIENPFRHANWGGECQHPGQRHCNPSSVNQRYRDTSTPYPFHLSRPTAGALQATELDWLNKKGLSCLSRHPGKHR